MKNNHFVLESDISGTILRFLILLSFIVASAFVSANSQTKNGGKKMEIKLQSSAFKKGYSIPSKYTCDGANISPQLKWNNPAKGTKTFAIIVTDPDAPSGEFVHWVVYNIPDSVLTLHEDVTPTRNIPDEVMLGTNGAGRVGYFGPCPPSGTHRYFFKIYALDTALHLEAGADKGDVMKAMKGHILAEGELMGKYQRQGK